MYEYQTASGIQELAQTKLSMKLRKYARPVYTNVWQGSTVEYTSNITSLEETEGSELDRIYGVDVIVHAPDGKTFTVQEKCRSSWCWNCSKYQCLPGVADATFELTTGADHHNGGWYTDLVNYHAMMWATPCEDGVWHYAIIDMKKFRSACEELGGIQNVPNSEEIPNKACGTATFQAVPITEIMKLGCVYAMDQEAALKFSAILNNQGAN